MWTIAGVVSSCMCDGGPHGADELVVRDSLHIGPCEHANFCSSLLRELVICVGMRSYCATHAATIGSANGRTGVADHAVAARCDSGALHVQSAWWEQSCVQRCVAQGAYPTWMTWLCTTHRLLQQLHLWRTMLLQRGMILGAWMVCLRPTPRSLFSSHWKAADGTALSSFARRTARSVTLQSAHLSCARRVALTDV